MHGIGDRLRAWRERSELSQKDASTRLGVPARTYQNYEIGLRAPGAEAMEAFARAGINANWLLTGEGPMLMKTLHEQEAKNLLVHANTSYSELTAAFHKKVDELYEAQMLAKRLKEERDDLQRQLDQARAQAQAVAGPPPQQINADAFAAILSGIMQAMPGAPAARIAKLSVEFYLKTLDEGLITPTGIGEEKKKAG